MSKQKMIDAIRQCNQSAATDFLGYFDERQLASYLTRLTKIQGHRGRLSRWIREGDTPGIVVRCA